MGEATGTAGARSRLSASIAVLIAVLAIGAAVAAGHLVAVFLGVRASPFVAVGNGVRDLSPPAMTDWAIDNLGDAKKAILFIGIAVVMLIIAVPTGLVSRRSALPGSIIIAAFGVVGGVAVYFAETGQLALLAPAVSLIAGVLVFRWLHSRAWLWQPPDQPALDHPAPEDATDSPDRRRFLLGAGGVALGAGVVGFGSQLVISAESAAGSRAAVRELNPINTAKPVPQDAAFPKLGTPPFLTPNEDFYRVDTVLFRVPQVTTDEWQLRIHGMVEQELTFTFADITSMPLIERTITMACVSNPVGGPYVSTARFIGVDLRELLLRAGVRPGAQQLLSTSTDGFTVGTPMEVLLEPDRGALLAIGMNGAPLPLEHGFPARLVVPGLYGYVSATKWVTDLEVTTWQASDAYWLQRGWGQRAPIKIQSRIDRPGGFDTVPVGRTSIAGTAWHQHVGIAKVEVQLDGGPWREAELGAEYNIDTWRMWHLEVDLTPGTHQATVRATNRSGVTQTAERVGTVPDGATGRHSVQFTAG